jgi:hypothetical protein
MFTESFMLFGGWRNFKVNYGWSIQLSGVRHPLFDCGFLLFSAMDGVQHVPKPALQETALAEFI